MFLLFKKTKTAWPVCCPAALDPPTIFPPLPLLLLKQPYSPSPIPGREQAFGNREQAGMVSSDNMDLKFNLPLELQMVEGEGEKKPNSN